MINEKKNLVDNIKNDINNAMNRSDDPKDFFISKTGSEWLDIAENMVMPKRLFGDFWFEDEVCILFADTNIGKSILAVQIADSISRGESIAGIPLEAFKQPILIFDFELSTKQFALRYSDDNKNKYPFNKNFRRLEVCPKMELPKDVSFDDYLNEALEEVIKSSTAKVVIIDNITYLRSDTEKASDALPLMKHLKHLKNKYGLSLLILAHTPKRDLSKVITVNDLAGSKALINFCDSAFTIGESQKGKSERYLKQIKARNVEVFFGTENVISCHVEKPHNFLRFELTGYGSEREHLRELTKEEREIRVGEAAKLKSQGCTNTEIGLMYGVSEGAVRKWVKKSKESKNE